MNRILLPLVLMLIIFGVGGYYFLNHQKKQEPTPLPQGHVCEPDTLVCEDGTVLKREGPSCDFPPCPSGSTNSSTSSGVLNYSPVPKSTGVQVKIQGEMICLPHKNSNGPQTMECAFGLKGDDGNNYGLTDPGWKYLIGVGTGVKVEVVGRLNKKNDSKYDVVGVIEIESLNKL